VAKAEGVVMRLEDLLEMSRRLREEEHLHYCGYEPADHDQREPWIKLHAGYLLSREEALQEIREGRC
jgi:hypothetical protein